MRTHLRRPGEQELRTYLQALAETPFSYSEVGSSRGDFPAAYKHSFDRFYLGQGEAVWKTACALVRRWQMFPPQWTLVYPAAPPVEGAVVSVCFRQFGLWWKNACRVVYCEDQPQHFGFAYGTLSTHVGSGEEYFGVERDDKGKCWFVIKAFSLPQYWGARLLPFYMRRKQRDFIGQAGQRMQTLVQQHLNAQTHAPS